MRALNAADRDSFQRGGIMGGKPVVFVTRKLPKAVEERLRRDYEARLNSDDRLYSEDELIERARGAQAILPCHTEHFSAKVLERLPP
jgi:lactate dehydrogenase-like 2-hydroxyacid dehydrogenase